VDWKTPNEKDNKYQTKQMQQLRRRLKLKASPFPGGFAHPTRYPFKESL
jgi:hypothetical protein